MQELKKVIDSPLFGSDQKKWKSSCINKIEEIKQHIQALNELITDLPPTKSAKHYTEQSKKFKVRINKMKETVGQL